MPDRRRHQRQHQSVLDNIQEFHHTPPPLLPRTPFFSWKIRWSGRSLLSGIFRNYNTVWNWLIFILTIGENEIWGWPYVWETADLLVHLAGQVGAQQSGLPANPLHLAGHSPQREASAHSTSHLGTQHLKSPENSSHPASHRPAAAASWAR